ncbi:MAG: hypothetical protein GY696_00285 [Gammaproteobacteria bacterium]|nr:hypothetical protein [Gammaproteobacteria bacterium]
MANEEEQDQVQFIAPLTQLQPQQQVQPLQPDLPVVDTPETEDQRKDHAILTKARDRLHGRIPKYNGPGGGGGGALEETVDHNLPKFYASRERQRRKETSA